MEEGEEAQEAADSDHGNTWETLNWTLIILIDMMSHPSVLNKCFKLFNLNFNMRYKILRLDLRWKYLTYLRYSV